MPGDRRRASPAPSPFPIGQNHPITRLTHDEAEARLVDVPGWGIANGTLHRELEFGYCRLVTITTDNLLETNEYRSGVGAHWVFLSDPRRVVQKDSSALRLVKSREQCQHR